MAGPFSFVLVAGYCAVAVGAGVAAGPPPAADLAPALPDKAAIHHEVPQDPLMPWTASPFGPWRLPPETGAGLSPGVQVNVDEVGQNIVGDAANEPSLAVDPLAPNRLVIGWRQFDTIASNFRQAGWAYSHDGGRTWTFPGVIEPGVFRSDPVLDADADGRFFYYSLTTVEDLFICHLFRSTDGGVTWGPQTFAFGGDKQWMTIDRSTGIGRGTVYGVWSPFFSCCPGNLTKSRNSFLIFIEPIVLPQTVFWGAMDVDANGVLYIAGVDTSFTPVLLRSSNIQNSQQVPVFDVINSVPLGGTVESGAGPNPGGLLGQVWVAVDESGGPTDGNVYIVASVNPPGSDPMDVNFSRSTDGGITWSQPVRINDDPAGTNAWQWFGTMDVGPDGRIDVVWNDTRNSGQSNVSELFYSFSTDGGVTWSVNEQLSSSFNSFLGWPNQNKIGDYYHLRSDRVGAHLAWAATFNGEQDVYYRRIGDYDCNDNGIGDADDLLAGTSGDCNGNEIPDECEIAAGVLIDSNGDGVPDICESIPGDLNGDGVVDINDLLGLLAAWGPCPSPPAECPADLNGDGVVDITDLLGLLANWS
ncbi:MAG: dockerin type I domain-containing protein [Planctomycetota bacterium]|jgi:hypothetical protein